MGKRVDLVIEQGATFQHEFQWLNKADETPVDLTGWTARMHVREDFESAITLFDLSSSGGEITITPASGLVGVEIGAAETSAVGACSAVYDLELEETATGFVERLAWGNALITREVTR